MHVYKQMTWTSGELCDIHPTMLIDFSELSNLSGSSLATEANETPENKFTPPNTPRPFIRTISPTNIDIDNSSMSRYSIHSPRSNSPRYNPNSPSLTPRNITPVLPSQAKAEPFPYRPYDNTLFAILRANPQGSLPYNNQHQQSDMTRGWDSNPPVIPPYGQSGYRNNLAYINPS